MRKNFLSFLNHVGETAWGSWFSSWTSYSWLTKVNCSSMGINIKSNLYYMLIGKYMKGDGCVLLELVMFDCRTHEPT